MSSSQLRERIAALRAEAQAVAELVVAQAPAMSSDELFDVTGELQGVLNCGEGAQLVAAAHAASHETRLTDRGPVEVHHGLGFIDAMAPSEVSLATGVGQWAAGRRVSLGATAASRFPRLLGRVLEGDLCAATVQRVVTACDGLDASACAKVEALLVGRIADLDPGRVAAFTRRIAARVASDQLRAAHKRTRRDKFVEVRPGPDGSTWWSALLPAATSAAAWSAITTIAKQYADEDPELSVDHARAEAFTDLLLRNVKVSAKVTLGIPVITNTDTDTDVDTEAAASADTDTCVSADNEPAVGGQGLGDAFRISTVFSGCEIPGIGFIDADTVETLLQTVPLEVGRALLDARTGTLLETNASVYRPTKGLTDFVTTRDGTCRMWGCDRPSRTCDLDHVRPWPAGSTSPGNLSALCRRHHRLKQRARWTYTLHPDGTVEWVSPSGKKRTTHADHAMWPAPEAPRDTQAESVEPAATASPVEEWGPPPF